MSSFSNVFKKFLLANSYKTYPTNHQVRISNSLLNWFQVRYRRVPSFHIYRQPHFRQKLLLSACEPVFAKPELPTSEKCGNLRLRPPKPHHPHDVLLAKDMSIELKQSQLVCLFHQNQMSQPERRLLKNEFQHNGMALRYYNKDIAKICMENTQYEPLLQFAIGYPFTILFAPDLTKIKEIFKIIKKYPQVILISALVENRRLITVQQLQELQTLNDLDHQRALLWHTLYSGQQSLLSTLNYHTSQLGQLLKTHHNQLTTSESKLELEQQN